MTVANSASFVYEPLFDAPDTFMHLPRWHVDAGSQAAIVGLPFDCGSHARRSGSRLGPSSIRERSQLLRPFHPVIANFNASELLGAADCGNVRLTPGKVVDAYARIERSLAVVLDTNAVPICLGGDGAVTVPQLRAVHRYHPDLVALHIDSHTDAYPSYPGVSFGDASDRFNTATTFVRAAEEGLIDVRSSIHVGIRGFGGTSGNTQSTREMGYQVIESDEMFDIGFRELPQVARPSRGQTRLSLFRHGFLRSLVRSGRRVADLGWSVGQAGLGIASGAGRHRVRRVRHQHRQPAS